MVRDKYKKPQCHLKICEKLKIIAIYEEQAKIQMRKFTEVVQIIINNFHRYEFLYKNF